MTSNTGPVMEAGKNPKKTPPCEKVFVILPPLFPRRLPLKDRARSLSARGTSVKEDWRAWLPEEKDRVFRTYVQQLEASYLMLSVSLNEAIEMRQAGNLAKSFQVLYVTAALCPRLTDPLAGILRALGDHAKHYGTMPNTAPLDPGNFQSIRGQRSARLSGLLSRVLLTQRSQFLHKIGTLHEMVVDLGREFYQSSDELASGASVDPISDWTVMDITHYDLNTCLREAIVLLKSFLRALPEDELTPFQEMVSRQMRVREAPLPSRQTVARHRRMTAIAGQ